MSILVTASTKVIAQGVDGRFHVMLICPTASRAIFTIMPIGNQQ